MQESAAVSRVLSRLDGSIAITAARGVSATLHEVVSDHLTATMTLSAVYAVLHGSLRVANSVASSAGPVGGWQLRGWQLVDGLQVAHDIVGLSMASAIMAWVAPLAFFQDQDSGDNAASYSNALAPVVSGVALLLVFAVLRCRVPSVASLYTGMLYAFADVVHASLVLQNRPTQVVLGVSLLGAAAWVQRRQSMGAGHADTLLLQVLHSLLSLVSVSFFVVHVLLPTQSRSPVDDVVQGLAAACIGYAFVQVALLPGQASGSKEKGARAADSLIIDIMPYVVSNLAGRISALLASQSASLRPFWTILVCDAVVYVVIRYVTRLMSRNARHDVTDGAQSGGGGLGKLLQDVVVMVGVSQVLSNIAVLAGASRDTGWVVSVQYWDELFLLLALISCVHAASRRLWYMVGS